MYSLPMIDERADAIRKLLESDGWKLINAWLTKQDERINNAIKKDLLRLKWGEKDKWFPYYSGQFAIIESLRAYVEAEKSKEERSDRIHDFKEKTGELYTKVKRWRA